MFTGKRFKLRTPIIGAVVAEGDGRGSSVSLPAGAIIKIKSGPTDGDGMVDVLWEGRTIAMFAIALHLHAVEIMVKNDDSPLSTSFQCS